MEFHGETIKITPCTVKLERLSPKTPKQQLALSLELKNAIAERNMLTSKTQSKYMQALDELQNNHCPTKPDKKRKQKLLHELLDSECVYLKQLEIVMNFFMKPILDQQLIKPNEYEIIFGNINTIYKVNGELLTELKNNLMHIANAFKKMTPFFKLYSVYAFDYKKVMNCLENLLHSNKTFRKFLIAQETRPEVQSKLSSLLIAPIQRVPRYCLLIKEVLDCSDEADDDYQELKETHQQLQDVASHINSLVQECEDTQHLLELVQMVKDGKSLIIKPGRKLIKDGVLSEFEYGNSIDIYVIAFNDQLMFCNIKKSKLHQHNALKCTTIYPLNKCRIVLTKSQMIKITCQERSILLFHSDGIKTIEWFEALENAVTDCLASLSTLRKSSSARRPAVQFNINQYKDEGISPSMSRIRKRRHIMEEVENAGRDKIIKLSPKPREPLFSVSKRRSLHIKSVFPKMPGVESNKDSLYPLRTHLQDQEEYLKTSDQINMPRETKYQKDLLNSSQVQTNQLPYSPDVYIFGRENQGFSFRKLFTGIASSIKRVFGHKQT